MTNFVENATLKTTDASTKQIRKINRELEKLFDTVKRNDRRTVRILGLDRAEAQARRVRTEINRIPRTRATNVRVGVSGVAAARTQIDSLRNRATRQANIQLRVPTRTALAQVTNFRNRVMGRPINIPVAANGVAASVANGFSPRVGTTFGSRIAQGFRTAFNPVNAGRTMGRAMIASLGGEFFNAGRQVAVTTASAPITLDDSRARVRLQGRNNAELDFLESEARRLSGVFQATSAADLLGASGEFTGRLGDLTDPAQQALATQALERFAANAQVISAANPELGGRQAADQARLVEVAIQQAGASLDPVRAQEISDAVLRAVIASGGDLIPSDVKRTLQQLSTAGVDIGPDTLQQVLLNRDEFGRRGTGEFRQAFSDLFRESISDENRELQVANGLRRADGTADQRILDSFRGDFLNDFIGKEIIPRLQEDGVNINDQSDILRGLTQLGFVQQGGLTVLSRSILNFDEALAEFNRSERITPETAIDEPTVRQQARAVSAQFSNVASDVLDGALPAINRSLDGLSDTFAAISEGNASTGDIIKAGGALTTAAIGAGLVASLDPATRPLGTAGLALSSSAAALSGSAAALTGAAALQGAGGVGRGRGRAAATGAAIGGAFRFLRRASPAGAFLAGLGIGPTADGTLNAETEEAVNTFNDAMEQLRTQDRQLFNAAQQQLMNPAGLSTFGNTGVTELAFTRMVREDIEGAVSRGGADAVRNMLAQTSTSDVNSLVLNVENSKRAFGTLAQQASLGSSLGLPVPENLRNELAMTFEQLTISLATLQGMVGNDTSLGEVLEPVDLEQFNLDLESVLGTSAIETQESFDMGATTAAQAMQQALETGGQNAAAALQAAIENGNVTVNQRPAPARAAPQLDTGGTGPF